MNRSPRVVVVGAGPAGLAAAEVLAEAGAAVVVLERMPSPARKLLIAGRGGLNLTHSEPLEALLDRYGAARDRLAPAIEAFPPAALRDWAAGLGQEIFVGSSGRVFPRAMKASPLLRAWLARLNGLGVELRVRTEWAGFAPGGVTTTRGETLPADALILACGGATWPRLGADGRWTERFPDAEIAPLAPANCGVVVEWSEEMARRWAGAPLKGCAFAFAGRRLKGEATITSRGLEGGAIYALSAALREAIARDGDTTLLVDLKPDIEAPRLAARLAEQRPGLSLANRLRRLGVAPAAAALLREAGPAPKEPEALAARLKAVPVPLVATDGMERAISTAGGLRWDALDARLMLARRPGVLACGEMLDWEAPTGGYLLQACFATGRAAGAGALAWLSEGGRLG